MNKLLRVALVYLLCTGLLPAAEWGSNYFNAMKEAKAKNKLVLLDFTGSDWCGYCKLLDREVFATDEFKTFADKNFVLVTVDFPRGFSLPSAVANQNSALGEQFKANGYPTLIVLDADGKELGRTSGYSPGSGPSAVIAQLKGFGATK